MFRENYSKGGTETWENDKNEVEIHSFPFKSMLRMNRSITEWTYPLDN